MEQLAKEPKWGLLVEAPVDKVREFLTPLGDVFIVRTNGGWTAAFCMEPGNDRYDEAIAPLRFRGHVPIYRFDFSNFEFMTLRWDGECWTLLEKGALFVCPGEILDTVGIKVPYWDELPPITSTPIESREAIVVEGASVEQVRVLIGDRWRIEPGPRGAIVYGPDGSANDIRVGMMFNETRFALWEHAPGRVLEVEFYPKSGNFWFRVMKGEECLGTSGRGRRARGMERRFWRAPWAKPSQRRSSRSSGSRARSSRAADAQPRVPRRLNTPAGFRSGLGLVTGPSIDARFRSML